MKKYVVIFGLICCLFSTKAMAANCDYSGYCAQPPYDLASTNSRTIQKITGMNFIAEKVVQSIIKKELKKATKENFKVEMKSYSAKDLLQGKFKSLKFSGKNLEIDGAYLSSFEAQTLCSFNSIENKKNSIKFRENMAMSFGMEISNTDLKRTIKSSGYLEELNKINLSAFGITFFKLAGADVEIKNNKLFFTINVTTPLSSKQIPVTVASDVKVEDGQIVFTKLYLTNIYTMIDLSKMAYLLNALNPLTFSTDILDNKEMKTKITAVNIIGDRIFIKGNILIPKDTIKQQ